MKINLKKILFWFGSIVLMLAIVLVIHIYLVTRPNKGNEVMRQLSRIDFKEKVDSTQAAEIKRFVAHLDGIESTYFNVPEGKLVYTYLVGKQTSLNVFNKLEEFGHYKAERYLVDAAALKKGCPMIDNSSFSGKLTAYISHIFK